MTFPRVDVVIPAYNAGATVGAAIGSCLAQTAPDLRVIVVDDGSSDTTAAIVRLMAQGDPRVCLLSQANRGIAAAMNLGLAHCTADFVARLDADDLSARNRHALQLRHMLAHPDTVALSGAHREMDADGRVTGHVNRPPEHPGASAHWIPAQEPHLTQPFTLFRRAALIAAGGYRPLPVSEDSDLYWRMWSLGRLVNLPDILGSYRMHAGSISSLSIGNGRRMALCSQLAALSAHRRETSQPDLRFLESDAAFWAALADQPLARMIAAATGHFHLSAAEGLWLASATAAKLMELSGYRPYELQPSDCGFIADTLTRAHQTHPAQLELARMRSASAARLLRRGRVRDAIRLGRFLLPLVLARAATNRLYWAKRDR